MVSKFVRVSKNLLTGVTWVVELFRIILILFGVSKFHVSISRPLIRLTIRLIIR